MKKQYSIPLVWSMWGRLTVEAESEAEAIAKALGPETSLPEGTYLDDSIQIDEDGEIEISDCSEKIQMGISHNNNEGGE